MTRPGQLRAPSARLIAVGALGCLLGASALASAPAGAAPTHRAVVAWDGAARPVAGVTVVGQLPALRMSVVTGTTSSLARLARTPGVRSVAPDDAVQLASREDGGGWARSVLASTGLGGDAGQPGAGAGVRVAVVDTGVSDTQALDRASGRLVDAADTSVPGEIQTGGTYDDGFGHGTFMASVLAGGPVDATGDQALGVAPGATVLVVRVAEPDGSTSLSRVLGGLEWVTEHADQVDVVNLSLSHQRPGDAYGPDELTDAVEAVQAAGVTVVVSAGNIRGTVGDPGFDPKVITVGASNALTGRVAGFSGSDVVQGVAKPDLVANGVRLLGLLPTGSVLDLAEGTRHLPGGLFRGSGTSQAAAVTSGLAAIFLAANPDATPAQVKASLRCAAMDLRGSRDGAGAAQATTELCAAPDGTALDGSGTDLTGEAGFDANAWAANAWAANAWAANAWAANAWAANAWAANAWAANAWAGSAWGSFDGGGR